MRIGEGACSLSPAALMLDLAPSLTFEELLGLAEELEEYRSGAARAHGRNAAETVARMMYKRAGRYFRPRATSYSYQERRVTLLAELRKALGVDQEMEPARLRIGEQMTNFQDV